MSNFVVFGATSTGAAIARRLLLRNCTTHIICRDIAKASASITSTGPGTPIFHEVRDVGEPGVIEDICKVVNEKAEGKVAGLVYAIGSIPLKPLRQMTRADFDRAFHVNAVSGWA
jgi:NAD(P)-dependent dehydrogenase (short-subunit alcohol dehydrogenase family)